MMKKLRFICLPSFLGCDSPARLVIYTTDDPAYLNAYV